MDRDLVVQAQRGDLGAFEALATSSHPRLFRVALGILRDADRAEDATQATMVDVWRYLPRLRDPRAFDSWFEDDAWSAIALEAPVNKSARSNAFYGLDPLIGGGVRLLERDAELDYRYDADGLRTVRQLGPQDPVTTSDGAVFGTANPRSAGLIMIPADGWLSREDAPRG
jgi:hypothetical protein